MSKIALLYSTFDSVAQAETLAEEVVKNKLAACVNLIPHITSFYMWENTIHRSSECALIFKTSLDQIDTLKKWLKENHPHTLPALLCGKAECSSEFQQYVQQYTT